MSSPAESLARRIDAWGNNGLELGTDLFANLEPDAPDELTALFDSGGGPDPLTSRDASEAVASFSVQVVGRSKSHASAWLRCRAVVMLLQSSPAIIWDGNGYESITKLSGPGDLGRDEHNRFRVVATLDGSTFETEE